MDKISIMNQSAGTRSSQRNTLSQIVPLLSMICILSDQGVPESKGDSHDRKIVLKEVYSGIELKRPIMIAIPPDESNRYFFVQQTGEVLILPNDREATEAETFLDLSNRNLAKNDFEEGLLNLSFHPSFKQNGKFYLYYSQQAPKRSVISEFRVSEDNPNQANLSSERILMEIRQPFWNHNSGNMSFGPDNYLYIAVGDGGNANDPHNLAQNLFVFNGKILRIDVDGRSGSLAYGIPKDNPFYGREGIRHEIWCYGMRNPWGTHFDSKTGQLWCADVGQNLWEEIDIIQKGGNYGWNYREGNHRFDLRKQPPPEDSEFLDPIHEYPREDGKSITGGFVYRGNKIPWMQGLYLYGDWSSGTLWALKQKDGEKVANHIIHTRPKDSQFQPTAFSQDENGELFVFSWDGKTYEILDDQI